MGDLPKSRKEAVALGVPRYFTGKPCKRGHIAERRLSNGACFVCERARLADWAEANPEKVKASQTLHYYQWPKGNIELKEIYFIAKRIRIAANALLRKPEG